MAIFFSGVLIYQFAPKEGESSAISNLINKWASKPEDWEEINTAHALAAKQAGFDRNLFENATPTNRWVDVAYPEYALFFYLFSPSCLPPPQRG